MKKILFRADGNHTIGLGHLFRLFSLIEMFKEHYDCILLTKADTPQDVIPKHYQIANMSSDIDDHKEADWIAKHYPSSEYILVLDGYQFNALYQQKLKQHGYFLLYIDDLVQEHMYADIVVNHSANAKKEDYQAELYTQFALGTDYAMLRPLFLQQAKQDRVINQLDTVFICFGGSDIFDLSFKAVQACLKIAQIERINVVLGGAYEFSEIFSINDDRLKIHQNLDEKQMLDVMQSSNLAIAPASTTLYELCCVKMPILTGYNVDNQQGIYQAVVNNNLVYGMGNIERFTTDDFYQHLITAISSININKMLQAQNKFFDGNSKERFLQLLTSY